jgi:pimeloyl-ACP methyl ester carboxylesterase
MADSGSNDDRAESAGWDKIAPCEVAYFGGNGHDSVRLERTREELARLRGHKRPIVLREAVYPGFEGREMASSLDEFLDRARDSLSDRPTLAVGSGIGGLIALTLRARGRLDAPLVLHAPVLWGLETRLFPKLMRWRAPRLAVTRLFRLPWFQARFVRKHFQRPLDATTRARFFDGYRRCPAFGQLFEWFTPDLLRDLEQRFRAHPERLERAQVWWGDGDLVLGPRERDLTEKALGRLPWSERRFPGWGHYPSMDAPREFADAIADAVDDALAIP